MLFISHDQDDEAPLSQVHLILKLAGIEYWDSKRMRAGELLREQLRRAIQECDLCLFIATRRSVGSSWCRAELGAFWGAGKRVISLLQDPELTDADLPPQLQGDLWTRNAEVALHEIREEVTSARSRRALQNIDAKRSVCSVRSAIHAATGYLVSSDLVVCPDYVCANERDEVQVSFLGCETVSASVVSVDESRGSAALKLSISPSGLSPLRFAGSAQTGTLCRGVGFPTLAFGAAIPFNCEVVDPDYLDRRYGCRRVAVHSPIFASGPMTGFGGSPVWTGAGVLGHLYNILSDSDRDNNVAPFGIVLLSPAESILKFLGGIVDIGGITRV